MSDALIAQLDLIRRVAAKVANTQPEWSGALNALLANHTALREERDRLRAALRKRAVVTNGFVHWCLQCGNSETYWRDGEEERHAADCLAALQSEGSDKG